MRTLLASQVTLVLLVLVNNADQASISIDVWSAINDLRVRVELLEAKMNEGFASVALNMANLLKVENMKKNMMLKQSQELGKDSEEDSKEYGTEKSSEGL